MYNARMQVSATLKQKVNQYQPDAPKLENIRQIPLLFTVGITGSGKNALLKKLLDLYPDDYCFLPSYTTRQPRSVAGVLEKEGDQYHFVTVTDFENLLDNKEFVEAQLIHDKYLYGTSLSEIARALAASKVGSSDVDVQGVTAYKALGLNLTPIFVLPPSFEEWQKRLNERGEMPKAEKIQRYESALKELDTALSNDYYKFVINDDLTTAAQQINTIIKDPGHIDQAEQAIGRDLALGMTAEIKRLVSE